MLKILQARLQQYAENFQMYKLGLKKQRNQRLNCQNLMDNRESKRIPEKHLLLIHSQCQSLWLSGLQQTVESKEMWIPDHLNSWEICIWIKKQQLEPDMEQLTGSKLWKEYDKAIYCHPAYLTSMQNISCEMPGWMNHKLEPRLPGEISTTSYMQMISL